MEMNKAVEFWRTRSADNQVNPTPEIALHEVLELTEIPVLDFGCGFGRLAPHFHPQQYLGVDIAPHRIEMARERNPHHRFISIDSHKDLHWLGIFRTVIVDNVLHHVPDDEIGTMLKSFAEMAETVVQAEHIGTGRTGALTSHVRDYEEYVRLFGIAGFYRETHRHVWNPRRKLNFSVIKWVRVDGV